MASDELTIHIRTRRPAVSEHKRHAVRALVANARKMKSAVAILVATSDPRPTSIRTARAVDVRPEPINNFFWATIEAHVIPPESYAVPRAAPTAPRFLLPQFYHGGSYANH